MCGSILLRLSSLAPARCRCPITGLMGLTDTVGTPRHLPELDTHKHSHSAGAAPRLFPPPTLCQRRPLLSPSMRGGHARRPRDPYSPCATRRQGPAAAREAAADTAAPAC